MKIAASLTGHICDQAGERQGIATAGEREHQRPGWAQARDSARACSKVSV
ncbi:hypothetical protein [Glycocaulis sp.]